MTIINKGVQIIFPRLHQKAFHFEAPIFSICEGCNTGSGDWRRCHISTGANDWSLGAWLPPSDVTSDSGCKRFVGKRSRAFCRPSSRIDEFRIFRCCCCCYRGRECHIAETSGIPGVPDGQCTVLISATFRLRNGVLHDAKLMDASKFCLIFFFFFLSSGGWGKIKL